MKHRLLCTQQRTSVLLVFISAVLALVALSIPTKSAEAATAKIVNGTFSYAMKEIYDYSESWIYLDLNRLKMANGNDCNKHPHKYVWAALPSHFDKTQFGWNSNQTYDPSNTWENDVEAQVANCVEIQRELNGNYYAELTAGQTGTYIYQDISSEPGAIYKWSLKHCSRSKTHLDSMSVMIGSPSSQAAQNATRTTTNGLGNKTGSVGTIIATPSSSNYDNERLHNVDWETYTGTYVIPGGQTTTRFTFKAISSMQAILLMTSPSPAPTDSPMTSPAAPLLKSTPTQKQITMQATTPKEARSISPPLDPSVKVIPFSGGLRRNLPLLPIKTLSTLLDRA